MIDKAFCLLGPLPADAHRRTLLLGCAVYRRLRVPLLHPVLLTFVAVIVFLSAAGIDYPRYKQATSALDFALGMSVVALGYLLTNRWNNCAAVCCRWASQPSRDA